MKLEQVLKGLYASEINVILSSFWDGGYNAKIGDEMNGIKGDSTLCLLNLDDVAEWLDTEARRLYPDSDYAKKVA